MAQLPIGLASRAASRKSVGKIPVAITDNIRQADEIITIIMFPCLCYDKHLHFDK